MGLTAGRFVGGTVAERTNAPALKADESKGSGGSNPPRSAQCTRGRQAAGVVVIGTSVPECERRSIRRPMTTQSVQNSHAPEPSRVLMIRS